MHSGQCPTIRGYSRTLSTVIQCTVDSVQLYEGIVGQCPLSYNAQWTVSNYTRV